VYVQVPQVFLNLVFYSGKDLRFRDLTDVGRVKTEAKKGMISAA